MGANNADQLIADDEGGGQNEVFRFDFDGPSGNGFLGGPTLGNAIETTLGGGDSGGPSFVLQNGSWHVAGVNTFGFPNGGTLTPLFGSGGGGMLVPAYAGWIDGLMGNENFWGAPAGGVFATNSNWVGAAPSGSSDVAIFDMMEQALMTCEPCLHPLQDRRKGSLVRGVPSGLSSRALRRRFSAARIYQHFGKRLFDFKSHADAIHDGTDPFETFWRKASGVLPISGALTLSDP